MPDPLQPLVPDTTDQATGIQSLPGFAPLPPDINTPQPGALEQQQPGLELLAEKYLPSILGQEQERKANIAAMQQRMSQLQQGQSSFWPTAIAVTAALRGNYGPLWQMQEQKRKTAIMTAVQPDLIKASDLVAQGKHDDAIDLISTAATSVGDRAPEFIPMFQAMQARIAQKQQDAQTGKQMYQLLKAGQTEWDEKNPNVPYPGRHVINTLKTFVDAKQPIPQGLMNDIMIGMRQRTTMGASGMLTEIPMAGKAIQAAPQFLHTGDVTGYIADKLGSALGLTPDDVTNILNRGTVIKQGREVPVDPETQQYVRDAYTKLQASRVALQLSKDNPVSAAWVEQALRQGWSPEEIATRAKQGATSREAVFQGQLATETKLRQAEIQARLGVPPAAVDPNSRIIDNATGQIAPTVTPEQALAAPERFSILSPQQMQRKGDMFQIADRLHVLATYLTNLPEATDVNARIGSYVDRRFNEVLGLDPKLTFQQAMQAVAKRDIETYFNKNNMDTKQFDYLTRALTTPNITVEGAQQTLNGLFNMLQSDYQNHVLQGGQHAIPPKLQAPVLPQSVPTPVQQGSSGGVPAQQRQPGIIPGTLKKRTP